MPDNEVKTRIINVAADLFMENGFAGTSVRDIGDAAGVGQSSLYHHISNKGQILADIHQTFIDALLERLEKIEGTDEPATHQLREVVRTVLSVVEEHQARVTVFLREGHYLPAEALPEIREARDRVDAVTDRILKRGVAEGELREDLDVRLTRLAVYGMCNWSYQWFDPDGAQSSREIADYFADILLRGITSP